MTTTNDDTHGDSNYSIANTHMVILSILAHTHTHTCGVLSILAHTHGRMVKTKQ
jgi:hypothetical protein